MILTSARCVVWELYLERSAGVDSNRDFRAREDDVVGESDAAHMKEHLYSKLKELGMSESETLYAVLPRPSLQSAR